MLLPLLLIIPAIVAGAILAYGTHPWLAQFNHGVEAITWSRRLQWPMTATAILLCLALLLLVISGKRRAWWLLALLPILALFSHHFVTGPKKSSVIEDPAFVSVGEVNYLKDTDSIVSIRFGDFVYAFPYAMLFDSPVVLVSDREREMIVLWSPFANRVTAFNVSRDVRASDLEIVSAPANANLIYNSRLGQFINAVTGKMANGEAPKGFKEPLSTGKAIWSVWKNLHSDGKVMMLANSNWQSNPRSAVLPKYPMPKMRPELSDFHRVCLFATTRPVAMPSESLRQDPLNLSIDAQPVLVFRDPSDKSILAFDRHVAEDLIAKFTTAENPARPDVKLSDVDTNTQWSVSGLAIDGPKETKGKKLKAVPTDDEVYWGVMKFWYPGLQELDSKTLAAAAVLPTRATSEKPTVDSPKRKRKKPVITLH